MFTHWLVVDRYAKDDKEQIKSILDYLKKHKNSNAKVFFRNSGSFEWIVKLTCKQCYADLDLDVNSFSTNLRRLQRKPNDIYESKRSFEDMAMLKK